MENRASELISLAGLADPARGQGLRARFGDGRDAYDEPDEFRRELGEFYLRRDKEDELDELPALISHGAICSGHRWRSRSAT